MLRAQGYRVGKYTSPHLIDFRERIQIDGKVVDETIVTSFISRWTGVVEKLEATFFEATTAMALDAFAREEVDVAVIETGLGGRLDSTNVITPRAAIVTSIAIEHTEYLGSTIEEIATEKAGIFKRGVPAIIGERTDIIRGLLAKKAMEAAASRTCIVADEFLADNIRLDPSGSSFSLSSKQLSCEVKLGLAGRHQVWNASTAIAALQCAGRQFRLSQAHVDKALPGLSLPGRLQIAEGMVLDVAHNPDGVKVLVAALREIYPGQRFAVLLCVLSDKDWRSMIRELSGIASHFVFTDAPTAPEGRRWDLAEVAKEAATAGVSHDTIADFAGALHSARARGERLIITGSFHTVGDAMTRLQVSPLPR